MSDYKTLVLGATTNPTRYAYLATQRLLDNNIEVIPVGIRKGETAGIPIQNDRPIIEDVHTITLYLNPTVQKEYYDYILQLKPKRVIFNPGTENTELYGLLRQELPETTIEVACTLVLLSIDNYKS
ncbi:MULTISPECIES: CoA-binding protein [unclassified Aureispira]|uniref:CoA-binding protein n=1 Tax=unclassified Aureispira TaxID=2649989 RepID=UPI000698959F|nr:MULTISPECIES: CoA-binding protein [unclassified Aureispira]WMX16182.1 CoA-binding protein [Aureispira sp. CCB-E]